MKLHIQQCECCRRFAIRLDEEQQWCRWQRWEHVEDIKVKHQVVTQKMVICGDCHRTQTTRIALCAGSVT